MKNSIAHASLQLLAEFGEVTLDVFFPSKYSYAAMWRPLLGLERAKKIKKKTVAAILWRLKQEGLVERIGAKKIAKWRLTPEGMQKLKEEKTSHFLKNPVSDDITRLVIFDIPEQERRKRDVIRTELITCHFKQLQKSVWIGIYPLPEEFITLIDDLKLNGNVHIFSVREKGTITEIK